jgi:hypothetical protein
MSIRPRTDAYRERQLRIADWAWLDFPPHVSRHLVTPQPEKRGVSQPTFACPFHESDMYPKFQCSLSLRPSIGTSENERVNGHHPTCVSKRGVQIALFTTELSEVGLPCSAERRFGPMRSKTLLLQGGDHTE